MVGAGVELPDDDEEDSLVEDVSFVEDLDSVEPLSDVDLFEEDSDSLEELRPFTDDEDDDRESVMYQPLPLNTMPTGWIIFRNAPPHCSHVVSGGSEKLWRFSMYSLQAVQV